MEIRIIPEEEKEMPIKQMSDKVVPEIQVEFMTYMEMHGNIQQHMML